MHPLKLTQVGNAIGLLAAGLLLRMNGWKLEAGQAETIGAMLALADGTWSESDFAAWLRLQSGARTNVR